MTIYKRKWTVTLADGTKEERTSDIYTIEYRKGGRIKRVKGYKDKRASEQKAAKIQRALERGEEGLIDSFKEPMDKPLSEHVAAYVADLVARGRDDKYAYVIERRLTILAKECHWSTLRDITPNSFITWREKEASKKRKGRLAAGVAAGTLNTYLDAVRVFTNWCAQTRRMPGVPVHGTVVSLALSGVTKVKGEQRRKRRAFTEDQIAKLLSVSGGRAMVYRAGLALGLRRSELEGLLWGDLHLEAIRPYVQLRAEATKARRADRLDIPATLAADLRKHRPDDAGDADHVFPDVPSMPQWKADLKAAGIPYKDELGRQLDFHAGTRKTLCSRMHKAGVPLAVAMRRMRHTDSKLTLVDYVDDDQIGMEAGVLPEVPAALPSNAQATATQ